jgi:hypothetical protein
VADPRDIHNADQAQAALKPMAINLWAYFNELTKQGFSRSEALALTRDWQRVVLQQTTSGPAKDES